MIVQLIQIHLIFLSDVNLSILELILLTILTILMQIYFYQQIMKVLPVVLFVLVKMSEFVMAKFG